jgi:hypothetical protein
MTSIPFVLGLRVPAVRSVHVRNGSPCFVRSSCGVEGARRGQQRPLPGVLFRELVLCVMPSLSVISRSIFV